MIKLIDNQSGNSYTGPAFEVPHPGDMFRDKLHAAYCWATGFGGGTVQVEVSPDGTNWFIARAPDIGQAKFTAADHYLVTLRAKYVRGVLTGATAASGVNLGLY